MRLLLLLRLLLVLQVLLLGDGAYAAGKGASISGLQWCSAPSALRFRFWLATRLVSSVAFVCLLVSLYLFGFLGGWGGGTEADVNVHSDAASDICFLFSFAFVGGWGEGTGEMLTSIAMRLPTFASVFLLIFFVFVGEGAGDGGGY